MSETESIFQPLVNALGGGPLAVLFVIFIGLATIAVWIMWLVFPVTTYRQLRDLNQKADETNRRLAELKAGRTLAPGEKENPFL